MCFDCSSYFFAEVSKFDVMSAAGLIDNDGCDGEGGEGDES